MDITGRCHCGNITFELSWEPDPIEIPARACTCTFCTKHGGVWTSWPAGSLRVRIRQPELVNRYVFGTRTAEFHVCTRCGIVPLVTSRIDGHDYAVVNVNTFEGVRVSQLQRGAVSYEREAEEERLARRARNWIPDVQIQTG